MARKGKKKKNKAKDYTKKKFASVFCAVCRLCDSKSKPNFCFPTIYKSSRPIFVSAIYPNLVDANEWLSVKGITPAGISLAQFSRIFCETGVCTAGAPMSATACPSHDVCYPAFMEQVRFSAPLKKGKVKKQKRKKKHRQVYQPYPTFFMREGDDNFKKLVRKILHGDNDQQQDKDKGLPGKSKGNTDRSPKDSKS